ncbi:alpha/beta hydrolase [Mechercharimyces sp. CAU 1602]|uniref:alpha/beta hydrolase n=1 Tax=Mechercharimyces sp. CAU 1602 TaxID=2973933 RepID=UPI0021639B86|nr:alpha/beta hydrolase [Mechercharimyces sp. CAU 1602]MCS1351498.1 alpha/beta hydrolase [Mechercharimyces sp. CAU 1602]
MRKQVLFIHSAGSQNLHQGSSDLKAYLQKAFSDEYILLDPDMPDPENPKYTLWKDQLDKVFASLDSGVILIGHSLGGSVLLKYLSEEVCTQTVAGLFMIAAPYWGEDNDWLAEEYTLSEDFALKLPPISQIFLYHSCYDEIVPPVHLEHYMRKLPQANIRMLDGSEHAFSDGVPELIDDIKEL